MPIRIVAVAAIACSAALPAVARADKLQIVGSWGSNGQGDGQFSVLKDVAVAPSGDVYTVEDGGGKSNRVQRFSADGAFLGKAGSEGAGAGQLQDAWSLAVDANGVVFVADGFNEKVTRFNPDLSLLGSPWGTGGSSTGQFRNPEGIAVFGTDAVYVADRGNSQVDRYTAAGSPVAEFGSAGAADGQFNRVVEVVVDFNGDVYAVDRDNNRVQRFDANGGFIRSYGSVGTAPGQLRSPQDVAIDKFGNVWVADTSNMRVEEFASDGRFLANYDQLDALGFHPEGLSFGPNGDLYIADTLNDRILRVQTQAPLVPPPVIGETTTVAPEKGTVLVKLPPGASARAAGLSAAATSGFVPLTAVKSVPLGSTFDTSRGQVKLTTATKQAAITQVGHFGRGLFIPQQTRKNPLTTISMTGSKLGACSKLPHGGSPKATAAARKRSRSLFSNVKGHFRTRGRNSSATVRGTAFTMKDTCAGTVTSVSRGSVTVRDFTLRKNVKLKAHQKYFAKSPK
jgi:sugar lactone lactonase YvrE